MLTEFSPSELAPKGWLERQLEIQSRGQIAYLDSIWPDIRDSSWTGGSRDDWERLPYWLDGMVPLAWLTDNEEMKARCTDKIRKIIARQRPSGWMPPQDEDRRDGYDCWPFYLMGKVLAMYCGFTGDAEAEKALYASMKCLYTYLKDGTQKLFNWAHYRWFECLIPLNYLKTKYDEKWITELAYFLRDNGEDWTKLKDRWVWSLNEWTYETHIVNCALMMKYEAEWCMFTGDRYEDRVSELLEVLDRYNGNAVGTLNGDECLAGLRNYRGFELCSVMDMLYSLEILYRFTGDPRWAERIEKIAFNAMPATFTDDMWAHQYDQQVNQIECERFPGTPIFGNNNGEANLFGLEPHFGCCTANQGQGWPKLGFNIFYRTENGIELSHFIPEELNTEIDGKKVNIICSTDYPFRKTAAVTVRTEEPVSFELRIRIPEFTEELTVDGKKTDKTGYFVLKQEWDGEKTVNIGLEFSPVLEDRPYGLHCVRYGNLVFVKQLEARYEMLEYERGGVTRKYPYCDYQLRRESEWRFGFATDEFIPEEKLLTGVPFSSVNPPLVLKTKLALADWELADGYTSVSEYRPESDIAQSEPFDTVLVPYGCAKLRMTEMPVLRFCKAEESEVPGSC